MFYFSVGLDKIPVMTWCLNINAGDTCDALRGRVSFYQVSSDAGTQPRNIASGADGQSEDVGIHSRLLLIPKEIVKYKTTSTS